MPHSKPTPKPQPVPQPKPVHEPSSGVGNNIIDESIMFDYEDNNSFRFDFAENDQSVKDDIKDVDTVYGEVEDKVNKSTMLDSEDNYSDGFDFVSEDTSAVELSNEEVYGEETYSGEVEDRVNKSTMLDSEDNYSDGFDFIVGNDNAEEDIPTILPNPGIFDSLAFAENDSLKNDEDVLVGDVEDNVRKSNLIGNDDDDDPGFHFL